MAGMELLGRQLNIIPIAAGKPFRLRNASTALVVVTGATAAPTLNSRPTFGGSDTALPAIGVVYWSTTTDGVNPWNKLILSPKVSTFTLGTTAGLTTATMAAFHVYTSQLTDPASYLNVVMGAGLAYVIVGDLAVQRGPAAMEVLGA